MDEMTSLIGSAAGTIEPDSPATPDAAGEGGAGGQPWYSSVSEDRREGLERFKSLDAYVDSFRNAQQLIGKKGLAPPAEDAPPEEVAAFYEKIGRPESPDAYEWQPPEDADFEVDDEAMAHARATAHKFGFRPEQFRAAMDLHLAEAGRQREAEAEAAAAAGAAAERALRKEWGDDFDTQLAAAAATAKKLGLGELLKDPRYGNDPAVIRNLAERAAALAEDSRVAGGGGTQGLRSRLDEINNDPLLHSGDPTDPAREALMRERDELYRRLYPS